MTNGILIVTEDTFSKLNLEDKIEITGHFEMSRKGYMGNPIPLIGDPIQRLFGKLKTEARKYDAQFIVMTGEEHITKGPGQRPNYAAQGYYAKFVQDIDQPLMAEEIHKFWPENLIIDYI